jgi:uncharacterized protein
MRNEFDPSLLFELKTYIMPFGKYKGTPMINMPVSYLEWMATKGWPPGKLGMLLSTIHIIKTNGLEGLLENL